MNYNQVLLRSQHLMSYTAGGLNDLVGAMKGAYEREDMPAFAAAAKRLYIHADGLTRYAKSIDDAISEMGLPFGDPAVINMGSAHYDLTRSLAEYDKHVSTPFGIEAIILEEAEESDS